MLILTQNPMHDWRFFVDAKTGEILEQEDIIKTLPDGTGYVFDPNPVVTANDNTYRQPTATVAGACGYAGSTVATIDAQRATRTLKDLKLSGGVYSLDGVYAKIVDISTPASTIPTETNANNFKYSSSDERLGAVNLYYHIDTIQRYIQSLGITTANNRQTQAAPAVSGFSAYYSPGDKSLHMGISRPCHPDKSQEGDAIIHEYGHAIQDNQVPGWGGINPTTLRDETGAMEKDSAIPWRVYSSPISETSFKEKPLKIGLMSKMAHPACEEWTARRCTQRTGLARCTTMAKFGLPRCGTSIVQSVETQWPSPIVRSHATRL